MIDYDELASMNARISLLAADIGFAAHEAKYFRGRAADSMKEIGRAAAASRGELYGLHATIQAATRADNAASRAAKATAQLRRDAKTFNACARHMLPALGGTPDQIRDLARTVKQGAREAVDATAAAAKDAEQAGRLAAEANGRLHMARRRVAMVLATNRRRDHS